MAGDVWVDWAGLRDDVDKSGSRAGKDRIAAEHISFLPGGASLIEAFIETAVPGCDLQGHRFRLPDVLNVRDRENPLDYKQLIKFADRLKPNELPRSLLGLNRFENDPTERGKQRIRVETRLGFTAEKLLGIEVLRPSFQHGAAAEFVVLDDRRDVFRNLHEQWPAEIEGDAGPVVLHKLHGPLPESGKNRLWTRLHRTHHQNHIVIVSIDDLRGLDGPISRGLSWERTSLDLVWQLRNSDALKPLRDCRNLIVRFGIDGALHWTSAGEGGRDQAWLIYDPREIEGGTEQSRKELMVGYGSAFVAAVLRVITNKDMTPEALHAGIIAGLVAGRRLLEHGFKIDSQLHYPIDRLFLDGDDQVKKYFACREVAFLERASESDPGYWRLLDSVAGAREDFDNVVASVVTDRGPEGPPLLRDVPTAVFGAFRTYDRREIEQLRALYSLMSDYIDSPRTTRPLNVAVFGPPGSGKSFAVKQLASALKDSLPPEKDDVDWPGLYAPRSTDYRTFNLSQYRSADELAAVFHQVRDIVLNGSIPLIFFDEFDATLDGVDLGWLRYFLSPMQDAQFLDRGLPHPIGQAIFVFAGGTHSSYAEFARPLTKLDSQEYREFKKAKGPDFLSRLQATLDIPGINLDEPFDACGPADLFPCEEAIQLRRAGLLRSLLHKRGLRLFDGEGDLHATGNLIRAFLKLREFRHGNRSFEALLDMCHLQDTKELNSSSLPAPEHTNLHASARELSRLLAEPVRFSDEESATITKAIRADIPMLQRLQTQNQYEMGVGDIQRILHLGGCEFRKADPLTNDSPVVDVAASLSHCPKREHDLWVAKKRREGYMYGEPEVPGQLRHPWLVPWDRLPPKARLVYSRPIFGIPKYLAKAGYVVTRSGD